MEESSNKICVVSIGDGMYDNDYTFYEDGRIYREWDENKWNYNNSAWISANSIRNSHKEKILKNLEGRVSIKVSEILYPENK